MGKLSSIIYGLGFFLAGCGLNPGERHDVIDAHGAIIRTDTTRKEINLVLTAHEFADGFETILPVLQKHRVKASFFFTGDFYRNKKFEPIIYQLIRDGHYLGAHSDRHLLYCSWEKRDSLLVTRDEFIKDVLDNYAEMKRFGLKMAEIKYFMPPYEWYNQQINAWARELDLALVNFSPGTGSNQDWTYPELGDAYKDADLLLNNILDYEKSSGMNGFILLIHFGTDPRRTDKLYDHLDYLVTELQNRGYRFKRIDEARDGLYLFGLNIR